MGRHDERDVVGHLGTCRADQHVGAHLAELEPAVETDAGVGQEPGSPGGRPLAERRQRLRPGMDDVHLRPGRTPDPDGEVEDRRRAPVTEPGRPDHHPVWRTERAQGLGTGQGASDGPRSQVPRRRRPRGPADLGAEREDQIVVVEVAERAAHPMAGDVELGRLAGDQAHRWMEQLGDRTAERGGLGLAEHDRHEPRGVHVVRGPVDQDDLEIGAGRGVPAEPVRGRQSPGATSEHHDATAHAQLLPARALRVGPAPLSMRFRSADVSP